MRLEMQMPLFCFSIVIYMVKIFVLKYWNALQKWRRNGMDRPMSIGK